MLASNKAEALEWLRDSADLSVRTLGEMPTTKESVEFVQRRYDLGAVNVLAVEIDTYPTGQNAGHLLVQLPAEGEARKKLLRARPRRVYGLRWHGRRRAGLRLPQAGLRSAVVPQ